MVEMDLPLSTATSEQEQSDFAILAKSVQMMIFEAIAGQAGAGSLPEGPVDLFSRAMRGPPRMACCSAPKPAKVPVRGTPQLGPPSCGADLCFGSRSRTWCRSKVLRISVVRTTSKSVVARSAERGGPLDSEGTSEPLCGRAVRASGGNGPSEPRDRLRDQRSTEDQVPKGTTATIWLIWGKCGAKANFPIFLRGCGFNM